MSGRTATIAGIYDTLGISGERRRVLLINLRSIVMRRLGFTSSREPTDATFTTYRESVVPVLLSAARSGYLVLINGNVTPENTPMVRWLRSKLSSTTPDLHYSGILFTKIAETDLMGWFHDVVRPTPDSVVVDDYRRSSNAYFGPMTLANRLSSNAGTLWFELPEVFPAAPLPKLNKLRLQGKINLFLLLDSIPEITNYIAEELEEQPNVKVVDGIVNVHRNLQEELETIYVVKDGLDGTSATARITTLRNVANLLQMVSYNLVVTSRRDVVLHLLYYDVKIETLIGNITSVARAGGLRYEGMWDEFLTVFEGRVTRVEKWWGTRN